MISALRTAGGFLLLVVLAAMGRSSDRQASDPADGRPDRRARSSWRRWSRAVLVLALGLTSASFTVWIRLSETEPVPAAGQRSADELGLYVDPVTPSTSWPTLGSPLATTFDSAWSIRVLPGETTTAQVSLVLFPQLGDLQLQAPATVLLELPESARLLTSERLRVGFPDSCATWSDGNKTEEVRPEIIGGQSLDRIFVACTIPPDQNRQDLFIEMNASWTSSSRREYGVAQSQYILHRTFNPSGVVPESGGEYLPAPVKYTVEFNSNERIGAVSAPPSVQRLDSYSWYSTSDFELAFTIEQPALRQWVQPTAEISLLLAGIFFGLLPSLLWRDFR